MLLTQLLFYNIYMFLQIETENKIPGCFDDQLTSLLFSTFSDRK